MRGGKGIERRGGMRMKGSVCGGEKDDDGRGAYGRRGTDRPKKQIGARKEPPHEVN
jgi:hypothetical protein